jgi:hypothetical protein
MQRGSMLPLMAGLLALVVTISLGVSSLASLTLERHRLQALAETIALRCAESFDPATLRLQSGRVFTPLNDESIRGVARETLRATPQRHDNLMLSVATTEDGQAALITLQSTWKPPLLTEFIPASLPVRASARAQAIIH